MRLNKVAIGQDARIAKIEDSKYALQLAQMGILPQTTIKILQKNAKTIIIEAQTTRIILGSGIASIIEVVV